MRSTSAVRGRSAVVAAAAAAALVGATTSSALAAPGGVFSSTTYPAGAGQMSDTNVGLNANKLYQNAVNINGPALTINSVPFAVGGLSAGTNWALTGAGNSFTTNNAGNNAIAVGQQMRSLVTDFTYGGNPGVLTLNGLTVGQTYTFTHYATGFGTTRVMSNITATSGGDVTTLTGYNEDAAGVGNGALLRYTFLAQATSATLSMTPAVPADTFHWYGFSNEQVFTNTYNQTTPGSFNTGSNWSNTAVPALNNVAPSGAGSNAAFPAQAAATTITLDAPTTLGHLQFDGTNAYTLAGANALTIQTDNPGGVSVINSLAGTHSIDTPVTLSNDVAKFGAGKLVFNGTLTGNNRTLTVGNGLLQGGSGTTFQNTAVSLSVDNGLVLQGGVGTFTVGALAGPGNFAMVDQAAQPINLQVGNSSGTHTGVLSGTTGLTKVGAGTQTLGGANTFTGVVTINGGVLSVTSLGNVGAGGSPTPLGPSSNAPENIVLNGGSIGYSGSTAATTDRRFTVGPNGGGVDSSGTQPVTWADTTPLLYGGAASSRTFTLGGSNAGNNSIAAPVNDVAVGVKANLAKTGAGKWVVSTTNNYTGETFLNGGSLEVSTLTDYGVAGPLGARAFADENNTPTGVGLHFNGGTLRYAGATPTSTNRHVRVGLAGAGFDASGTVPSATMTIAPVQPNINLFDTGGARTFTLTGTNTGDNTFAVQLTNQSTNLTHLTKSGTGRWVLPAATTNNSYGGVTALVGGVLNVASVSDYGVPSSIGSRAAGADVSTNVGILFRGGTLQYTGSTPQSTNRQIRVSTTGGAFIDASGSNPAATLSFTHSAGNADLYENGGARQVTLTGTNTGSNTFAINLTDQAVATGGLTSVNKTGVGTWALTGNSTATGLITVSAGTLLVNGTNAAPATVTGGRLGGSGTIAGAVAVNAGGTLAPGNSPGVLNTGALTLASGSNALFEINGITVGTTYDQVNVTGTVTLGGGSLSVALGYTPVVGDSYTVIRNDGGDAVTGAFAGLPTSGSTFDAGGATFQINYGGGDGNDVTLLTTAVPEPASFGLLAVGGAAMLGRRRRRAIV